MTSQARFFLLLSFLLPPALMADSLPGATPYPSSRYLALWNDSFFPPSREVPNPAPPPPASIGSPYRLYGLATVQGQSIAYVQPPGATKILAIKGGPGQVMELLEVVSSHGGRVSSVRFRIGADQYQAAFQASTNPPYAVITIPRHSESTVASILSKPFLPVTSSDPDPDNTGAAFLQISARLRQSTVTSPGKAGPGASR